MKPFQRTMARRTAMQAIYQWQMTGDLPSSIKAQFSSDPECKNVDWDYFDRIFDGVVAEHEELDCLYKRFLEKRSSEDLDQVDRAILRRLLRAPGGSPPRFPTVWSSTRPSTSRSSSPPRKATASSTACSTRLRQRGSISRAKLLKAELTPRLPMMPLRIRLRKSLPPQKKSPLIPPMDPQRLPRLRTLPQRRMESRNP